MRCAAAKRKPGGIGKRVIGRHDWIIGRVAPAARKDGRKEVIAHRGWEIGLVAQIVRKGVIAHHGQIIALEVPHAGTHVGILVIDHRAQTLGQMDRLFAKMIGQPDRTISERRTPEDFWFPFREQF